MKFPYITLKKLSVMTKYRIEYGNNKTGTITNEQKVLETYEAIKKRCDSAKLIKIDNQ